MCYLQPTERGITFALLNKTQFVKYVGDGIVWKNLLLCVVIKLNTTFLNYNYYFYSCRHSWAWYWMNPSDIGRLCWSSVTVLTAIVQMNAKGMICLFFIEIVSHLPLASSILRRILMHWYQGGIIFFFLYNLLSNDLLIAASILTENYRSFLGNLIFTPFMSVYVAQVSRDGLGETDFEAQSCVNLCGVTPLLPMVPPMDSSCDSLLLSPKFFIVLHYLLVDKYSPNLNS